VEAVLSDTSEPVIAEVRKTADCEGGRLAWAAAPLVDSLLDAPEFLGAARWAPEPEK
jgi:hypothetical protein